MGSCNSKRCRLLGFLQLPFTWPYSSPDRFVLEALLFHRGEGVGVLVRNSKVFTF
jgi:hypothetical protein